MLDCVVNERGFPPPFLTIDPTMQMDPHQPRATDASTSFGHLRIYFRGKMHLETPIDGRVVLGRQRSGEPTPFNAIAQDEGLRVIVARRDNPLISRTHLLIERDERGKWIVTNSTRNCTIAIDPGHELLPGKKRTFEGTVRIEIEGASVVIETNHSVAQLISLGTPSHRFDSGADSLATSPVGHSENPNDRSLIGTLGSSFDANQRDQLLDWLRLTAQLFRHVDDPNHFIGHAVESIQRMIGGTTVLALSCRSGADEFTRFSIKTTPPTIAVPTGWTLLASTGTDSQIQQSGLKRLLDQMWETRQSILWKGSAEIDTTKDQSPTVHQMIATPVLDSNEQTIAAFVAIRNELSGSRPCPSWGGIEASLMELIASGVKI